ncbi:MAG: serine protease, partial [Planctomycetota bacterium]
AGDSTVGSGILLASVPQKEEGVYETHLLTAWHVVRDILADDQLSDGPVPVAIYEPSGRSTPHTARLLQFDPGLDVALLRLVSTENHGHGARLPSRESLKAKSVFDPVYAVGCPLGNDPIPTRGEIADLHHTVDEDSYWMISAPSYIGNSGGAIFDAESHELLGVFSKIYTHGTLRPTVVPHMGLATPLGAIYDWMERVGYASVAEQAGAVQAKVASAKR